MRKFLSIQLAVSCIVTYSLCMESDSTSLATLKGCLFSCMRVRTEESKKNLVWFSRELVRECETLNNSMNDSSGLATDSPTFEDLREARNFPEKLLSLSEDERKAIPIIPIPIDVGWVELLAIYDKKKKYRPWLLDRSNKKWSGRSFEKLQKLFIVSFYLDYSNTDKIFDQLANRIKKNLSSILKRRGSLELLAGHSSLIIQKLKVPLLLNYFIDKEPLNLAGGRAEIEQVALTPDQKYLITESYGTIKIWDVNSGELLHSKESSYYYRSGRAIFFTPDSKRVIVGSYRWNDPCDSSIIEIETGKETHKFDSSFAFHLTKDGSKLFLCCFGRENCIKIWDMAQERMVRKILCVVDTKILVIDETKLIWTGCSEVLVGEIESGTEYRLEHGGLICSTQLTPNGKKCVTYGRGRVKIWDIETGGLIRELPVERTWYPFVLDDTTILILDYWGNGSIFNMETGEILRKLEGKIIYRHLMSQPRFHLHKDERLGDLLAVNNHRYNGEEGGIGIWDIQTGRLLCKKNLGECTYSMALSSDGKKLVAGGEDGTIKIWNLYDDVAEAALDEASLDQFLLCNLASTDPDAAKELIEESEYTQKIYDSCPEILQNMISGYEFEDVS